MGSVVPLFSSMVIQPHLIFGEKIVPKISQLGRCIAIDLVGMGDSDKISQVNSSSYTLKDHKYYWRETLRA